jgi:alanyl-tRNA synthetase
MFSSADLRRLFLDFFRERGHEVVHSSSLVPANDPTLLFTNAGMVQFKDVFLGRETRPYRRAASSQRCVRAGGKHNDLENVGYTARHHTFFEMLGNFSFGDYFKREAIEYAWAFLTDRLAIPEERLWVTVFEEDDAAASLWLDEIKVDPRRFARIGAKDNFWSMGDTGPCGPCTEIFYDHGPSVAGGPPGGPDADGDRYVEIWNLVFMQYDRDKSGRLDPLPAPSVDTGMGLERLAAVVQGVHSNYDTDLFRPLIAAVADMAGLREAEGASLRVVADHIRSCAFLVTDGVLPSNDGRGYVLRRIIRRAIRHGHKLGLREPFFYRLVAPLVAQMGEAYPELTQAQARVERVLQLEEERFAETLDQGLKILDQAIAELSGRVIPGETAFRLYDTYGFPVDLTADIARERGLTIDTEGFDEAMAAQRARARAASQFAVDYGERLALDHATEFTGYEHLHEEATVIALYRDGTAVDRLASDEAGWVVLDKTPFYAEGGGQVGDTGGLIGPNGRFRVDDTRKRDGAVFIHVGRLESGELQAGDPVEARVDIVRRQATALNHTATHLLHAALRRVLGEHVMQKGSLVEPTRLRFDFAHFEPIEADELARIEQLVNGEIRRNAPVEVRIMDLDSALGSGAMALFDEKYGDRVRVLRVGDFSVELCGGTHVQRAGDIGLFKIVTETGVAAGVRRIEAVTGAAAVAWVRDVEAQVQRIADLVKAGTHNLDDRVSQLVERSRALEKEVERLKAKLASSQGDDLAARAVDVAGIKVLAARLEGADAKTLRDTVDQLKNKLGSAAIVLASVQGEKVQLVAGVSADNTDRIKAGELVNVVAQHVGGRGGGRPDLAQAGGNDPSKLDQAIDAVTEWVRSRVAS